MAVQRRTKVEWQALIAEFEASGQSAKDFCVAQGLSSSNFFKRRQEVRALSVTPFVPAKMVTGNTRNIVIDVLGTTIRCDSNVSTAWLAQLVRELRK